MSALNPSPPTAEGTRCRVTVCRGCHCGTAAQVPDLDHTLQLDLLQRALAAIAVVRTVDCLGCCERANVVVVQPSRRGRHAGGRPVWLGLVNDLGASVDVVDWVKTGGPGAAPRPDALAAYAFRKPRAGTQG